MAIYFYGGGYLNRTWGDRKLAMAKTIAADPDLLVASGLQLDEAWVSTLDPEDVQFLERLEVLGVRDPVSGNAARRIGGDRRVINTGDDAVGLLTQFLYPDDDWISEPIDDFIVNVHLGEHEWVTEDPSGLEAFFVAFLEAIQAQRAGPVSIRPLVAYADRRIDERPVIRSLAATLRERGIDFVKGSEEPIVLRPNRLREAVPVIREARMTVSCSYHLALTSAMLGVPTILIGANEY